MQPIGTVNALYPMPTTLVGATVNGKPNILAGAHVGILDHRHLSIGLGKIHYSNAGIHEDKTFSICLPSEDLMLETDYCGIMTGRKTDKAALFDVFCGDLETAPMIQQCPVYMELRLHQVIDFPSHDIFVGELIQTYADGSVPTDVKIHMAKLRPLLFDMASNKYWSLGLSVGHCWNVGKSLKRK